MTFKNRKRGTVGRVGVKGLGLHSAPLLPLPLGHNQDSGGLRKVVPCISRHKDCCQPCCSRVPLGLPPSICSMTRNSFCAYWVPEAHSGAGSSEQAGDKEARCFFGSVPLKPMVIYGAAQSEHGTHVPPLLCHQKTPVAFWRVFLC